MSTKRKVRRRAKETAPVRAYVAPMGDGSSYILLMPGAFPRQFESLQEAISARDEQVVEC